MFACRDGGPSCVETKLCVVSEHSGRGFPGETVLFEGVECGTGDMDNVVGGCDGAGVK